MKIKKANRRYGTTHIEKHIVKEQKELAQERVREIQSTLRVHYAGLERLFAFASGEKTLKKYRDSKQAQSYQQTSNDGQLLQWTVENLHGQIAHLQQELFQLIRSIT